MRATDKVVAAFVSTAKTQSPRPELGQMLSEMLDASFSEIQAISALHRILQCGLRPARSMLRSHPVWEGQPRTTKFLGELLDGMSDAEIARFFEALEDID